MKLPFASRLKSSITSRTLFMALTLLCTAPAITAQENNPSQKLSVKDSLTILRLLEEARTCLEEYTPSCRFNTSFIQEKINSIQQPALVSRCYRVLSAGLRTTRKFQNHTYDSLGLYYARLSGDESLIIQWLITSITNIAKGPQPATAAPLGEELLQRIEKSADPLLQVRALNAYGQWKTKTLAFTQAVTTHKKALMLAQKNSLTLWAARQESAIYRNQLFCFDTTISNERFYNAIRELKKSNGYDYALALSTIAQAFRMQGNHTKAFEYFDLASRQFLNVSDLPLHADMIVLMAECNLNTRSYQASIQHAQYALHTFLTASDTMGMIKASTMLGRTYGALGILDSSDWYMNLGNKLNERIKDERLRLIILYYTMERNAKYDINKFDKKSMEEAARIFKAQTPPATILAFINKTRKNQLFTAEQEKDIQDYFSGKPSTAELWPENKNMQTFNPYTVDNAKLDTLYAALFNKQLQHFEVRYRTLEKEKNLSLTQAELKTTKLRSRLKSTIGIIIALCLLAALLFWFRERKQKAIISQLNEALRLRKWAVNHDLQFLIKKLALASLQQQPTETNLAWVQNNMHMLYTLHNLVDQEPGDTISLNEKFWWICEEKRKLFPGKENMQFNINAPVALEKNKAALVLLIVSELVTNAFKYAYSTTAEPAVSVICTKEKGKIHLEVSDNGQRGIKSSEPGSGEGNKLVSELSQLLGTTPQVKEDKGLHYEFIFV
ncbi:MAG: sensor histidine kinase [Chitinophagaceae bacterium]|nr:sensor histidine kinase [Chitinophagaceae bacterium]